MSATWPENHPATKKELLIKLPQLTVNELNIQAKWNKLTINKFIDQAIKTYIEILRIEQLSGKKL